jgi:carnitine O-acetyltransferase
MQLAHFRLYGKIVSQYEPVLTKGYYHGRTEAMRTATEKAATFCETWLNPSATDEEKLQTLREATVYHSARIKDALMGKGIERHLFALKCIADKNKIATPDFFSSKAYQKLNHTILSTSNCGNPSLRCEYVEVNDFEAAPIRLFLINFFHCCSIWLRSGCSRRFWYRIYHQR